MIEWEGRDITRPPYFNGMTRWFEVTARKGKCYISSRLCDKEVPQLMFFVSLMERALERQPG